MKLHLIFIFFISNNSFSAILETARMTQWDAILHQGQFSVRNPSFTLSRPYSPATELRLSINKLNSVDAQKWICKFPARALFLKHFLKLETVHFGACAELQDFVKRAPAEAISVVFASGSMTGPTSALGHSFIAVKGKSLASSEILEHGFSFWTELGDVGPFGLVWKSFISGKKGFYSMAPLQQIKRQYLAEESRNLWSYRLKLSNFELQLLHYHLYELKSLEYTYFFHRFNCSTFVNQIVSIIMKDEKVGHLWSTPLDLIRELKRIDRLNEVEFFPSPDWVIDSLVEDYDIERTKLQKIKDLSFLKLFSESDTLVSKRLHLALAKEYIKYLHYQKKIDFETFSKKNSELTRLSGGEQTGSSLSLSMQEDPSDTIQDSQVSISYTKTSSRNFFEMTFLPVSHYLLNDLRGHSYDSEFRLGELKIEYDDIDNNIHIQRFTLLGIKALKPTNSLVQKLSGEFSIGYKTFFTRFGQRLRSFYFDGGIGKTWALHPDIQFYLMVGADAIFDSDNFLRDSLRVGALVKQIFNMKGQLEIKRERVFSSQSISTMSYSHSVNLKRVSIFGNYTSSWFDSGRIEQGSLGIGLLF